MLRATKYAFIVVVPVLIGLGCSLNKGTVKTGYKKGEDSVSKEFKAVQEELAGKLEVSPEQVQNEKLYTFVNEWIGVGYSYGGTTKSGIDCSGFSNALFESVYSKKLERRARDIFLNCTAIDKSELQEGDLVFFDIQGRPKSHVGVYLQNDRFVHASTSSGVIISNLNSVYYVKYFASGGRL